MQRNFSAELKTLEGQTIPLAKGAEGEAKPATLGSLAIEALMAPEVVDGEQKALTGEAAVKAYDLATRIFRSDGPTEVTTEEISLIKRRIAAHYLQPLVVGQALKMLEE